MAVCVGRYSDARVSQPLLDDLQMDTGLQQHAGVEVAQVVKPAMPLARTSCQLLEVTSQGRRVKWFPHRTGEHQAVILVC